MRISMEVRDFKRNFNKSVQVVKTKFLYSTLRFASLKDVLLAAPRMRISMEVLDFKRIFNKSVTVVKTKFLYSTVRFASLKDALLAGLRMGAAYRNSCFLTIQNNM